MRGAAIRTVMGLGLLLCGGVVGCLTTNPSAPTQPETPNAFVAEILKQEKLVVKDAKNVEIKMDPPRVSPEVVLREIPLQTPLANARAVMERHGFSCQGGVRDEYRDCLYCTTYRRKTAAIADRVTVKLYLEQKRVVDVVVNVEHDVKRSTGLFPGF